MSGFEQNKVVVGGENQEEDGELHGGRGELHGGRGELHLDAVQELRRERTVQAEEVRAMACRLLHGVRRACAEPCELRGPAVCTFFRRAAGVCTVFSRNSPVIVPDSA